MINDDCSLLRHRRQQYRSIKRRQCFRNWINHHYLRWVSRIWFHVHSIRRCGRLDSQHLQIRQLPSQHRTISKPISELLSKFVSFFLNTRWPANCITWNSHSRSSHSLPPKKNLQRLDVSIFVGILFLFYGIIRYFSKVNGKWWRSNW